MDFVTIITTSGMVALFVNVIGAFWIKERLKQSIKHEYEQELIKLKNDLEFKLDKKKKLYEGKLRQYKKYYSLMDSYSSKSRKTLFEGFQTGFFDLISKDPTAENTTNYIQKALALQGDVSDTFLTFKNEIDGLRLEAGDKLLGLLEQYVVILEVTQDKTVTFLNWMNANATKFYTEPDTVNIYVQEFMDSESKAEGQKLIELQKQIFLEMRNELGIV